MRLPVPRVGRRRRCTLPRMAEPLRVESRPSRAPRNERSTNKHDERRSFNCCERRPPTELCTAVDGHPKAVQYPDVRVKPVKSIASGIIYSTCYKTLWCSRADATMQGELSRKNAVNTQDVSRGRPF